MTTFCAERKIQKKRFALNELLKSLTEQAKRLIELGYHTALNMTEEAFLAYILETVGRQIPPSLEVPEDRFPALLVIPDIIGILPFETQLELLGIESDLKRPIRDIKGVTTPNHPSLTFGVQYIKSGDDVPLETLISRFQSDQYSNDQFLTLAQSLAMLGQFNELLDFCEGLVIAGSSWYIGGTRCIGVYTRLDGERRIISRSVHANYCGYLFGYCTRKPRALQP